MAALSEDDPTVVCALSAGSKLEAINNMAQMVRTLARICCIMVYVPFKSGQRRVTAVAVDGVIVNSLPPEDPSPLYWKEREKMEIPFSKRFGHAPIRPVLNSNQIDSQRNSAVPYGRGRTRQSRPTSTD